jgi:hypothetical protein
MKDFSTIAGGLGILGSGFLSNSSIRTKADAMKFAIEATFEYTTESKNAQLDKALEIYEFFCKHVKLEDTDFESIKDLVTTTIDKAKEVALQEVSEGRCKREKQKGKGKNRTS